MISYQNAKTNTGADTRWYSNGYSEVPFIIHIDNRDGHDSHTINVDYQTAVFRDENEVEYIIDRLEYILEQIVEDSAKLIRDICIVPKQEWKKVVYEFNDTYVEYPREKCVHELFSEQVARTPDKVALVFEDEKFTYRQLDEMSNSLAHFLRDKGVKPNDKVAVLLNRDEKVVLTQLAVLKLGAVFIPIDSRYPKERIEYILSESNANLIIKNKRNSMIFPLVCNIEEWQFSEKKEFAAQKVNADDICYIIFTSGSTGKPKGCTLTHRGLANFCRNNNILKTCNQLEHQVCVSVNTISFDYFIAESLLPLVNGYTIVLANEAESIYQKLFSDLVIKNQVNIIQTTPTRYKLYFSDQEDLSYTRQFAVIVTSGETLSLDLLKSFRRYTNASIFNPLGPSECSVWAAGGELHLKRKEISAQDITIGKPIANTQIYILDKDSNPLPIGVAGELCIAGDGVGKGYLNRPELTAERFVPNPFATEENHHGKVMYHTGDLARWRADGEIEYLGRIDTQVKIRGLRIELGEIESVMSSMEGVGLTAVADKRDENNRQYLVGYYTADMEIDEKKLRQHLSAKLPKYMVPNYFVHLDVMPMTASGKTDRKNLPIPDFKAQTSEYAAPATDTEKKLAGIWRQLLHIERVGREDDFFELGGDSLLAISMLNEIETEFHVEISVKDIMEKSILKQLALCIEKSSMVSRIQACHEKKYVLLPQQKAIYAVCSKNPDTLVYNMPAKISLPENIDRDRLVQSISKVLNHHKMLKSYIMAEESEIYGIYDEDARIVFEEHKNGEELAFVRPFDMERAPLVRIGFTENALLFDMHHIVGDGESLNIILRDITTAYEGMELQEAGAEYSDYAKYFYGMDTAEHKAYFKEMLKCDFEPILLPETKNAGYGGKSKLYRIPEEIFSSTKEFARKNGLTDTMVFLGAYGILLSKYTAQKDILSSIVLQNRIHADTGNMVGMFVNTLPIHLAVKGTMPEYMQEVKQLLLHLFRYQELPFWDIANAVEMSDKSVINTSFVYQGDGEKTLALNGEKLVPQFIDTHTAKFDLSMELTPQESGCRIRMEYNAAKYEEALIDELADAYIRILAQLEKASIANISVLSEGAYHKVVEEFNDTYVEYPREKCVHELFSEQAARTPDKIALVFEDEKFTYRQLDEMSNSLAHFLRDKGVKPNDVVPIIAKRSWHVIVAMLGVLKAGGAYMPVDPEYPKSRIEYMIESTNAKMIMKYGYNEELFVESIALETFDFTCNEENVTNVNDSKNVCYVLYTSGTTGIPKGIEISHRNLVNFISRNEKNRYQSYAIGNGSIMLAGTVFTFDISIFEIYMSLLNGLSIVLANDNEINSPYSIANLMKQNSIDILHCTPTKILMLLNDNAFKEALQNISVIMIGAEEFTCDIYHKLLIYTNAVIFNGYGPTEITIGASFKKVSNDDITIGKPIANTQIYILDKDSNPLPIGVAGELCIAGDGVGKGYLNRPELIAERFVPNPFATEENHHGKVMYHTGDLARWRADGEIEYLGRIDTQVKIRGLRIELGEIESVMSSMEGIGLTAVADKRDENNRQYLVGYYTADMEIDEKKLRWHLSAKLPKYMIPNYFMHLDVMPMTASGKTDRKNLPIPDFKAQTSEYAAPKTEREKNCAVCWKDYCIWSKSGLRMISLNLEGTV